MMNPIGAEFCRALARFVGLWAQQDCAPTSAPIRVSSRPFAVNHSAFRFSCLSCVSWGKFRSGRRLAVPAVAQRSEGWPCQPWPNVRGMAVPAGARERRLARRPGLEPGTCGLENRCSVLLSYRRINQTTARSRNRIARPNFLRRGQEVGQAGSLRLKTTGVSHF